MDEEEDDDSLSRGSYGDEAEADRMMMHEDGEDQEVHYIGPITEAQRLQKVRNYWIKK